MTQGSSTVRETARRLLERETAGATDAATQGAAVDRAYRRVADTLQRFVGEDGYSALLARALVKAQAEQPLLKDLRRPDATSIHLDLIDGAAQHGPVPVANAVEGLLAAIVGILSDLIGADMVKNLLDHDTPPAAGREQR